MNQVMLIFSAIQLSLEQEKLQVLLSALHENLMNITVEDRHKRLIKIWYLIEHPEKIRRTHILTEDSIIAPAVTLCQEIISLFGVNSPVTTSNVLYKGRFLLGGIDYQRIDFLSRFQCEQFFIKSDVVKKIDCVWVESDVTLKDTVVLYCCPNGGFYEYIYYQTD